MRITKKDIEILKERATKPNQKLREIAKKVGISHVAVSKSIKKLEKAGMIKNHLCVNLEKTNWIYGLLRMSVVNSEKFIEKRSKCPFVVSSSKSNDEHNLVMEICAYDESSLQRFLDRCIRANTDVKKSSFEELKHKTPSFIGIDLTKTKMECEECQKCEHHKVNCQGCGVDSFLKTLKL